MILAPNRQLQLNGNKLLFLILFSLLILSCSTSSAVYRPGNMPTDEVEVVSEDSVAVDTTEWTVVLPEEELSNHSTSEEYIPLDKKSVYNVALLLPIEANKPNTANDIITEHTRANRFISFYAGAIIALTHLEQEGLNLHLDVYDSQRNAEKVKRDLQSLRMQKMDAIIGPYASSRNKDGLIATAEFAKKNKLVVVSPWYASSSLAKENPYYIQMRPNLEDHYHKIIEHAKSKFSDEEIILLARKQSDPRKSRSDAGKIRFLQKVHKEISGDDQSPDLALYEIDVDSLVEAETVFTPLFEQTGRKAIIFPYYSSSDEAFVYNTLRRLNGEKGLDPVHVYTMPLALESEQIGFNLYRNLHMKVCRSKFVDKSDAQVRSFEKEYYDRFGAIPTDDAYHGFDVMYFVGQNLQDYGRNFQFHLKGSQNFLQSSFRIEKVLIQKEHPEEWRNSSLKNVNYFVNKHLDIIEFNGNSFNRGD